MGNEGNETKRPNYYILLELPFEPPETDTQKIKDAINEKRELWTLDLGFSPKMLEASENLKRLADIERVMLDPDARKTEADKAREIKESERAKLEEQLTLYQAIGDTLAEQNLKQLMTRFGRFGFTEGEIQRSFEKGRNRKIQQINPSEVLDPSVADKVKKYLGQLHISGEPPTLYDFMKLPDTSSAARLHEAALAEKSRILHKGDKLDKDKVKKEAYALCAEIFENIDSKRKYDNYIKLTENAEVNDAVDALALGNHMEITPGMKEGLIDVAVRRCGLNVPDASMYIANYCAYKGYILSEGKVICGNCGVENPAGSVACGNCGKTLAVRCPSCGRTCDVGAMVCRHCGFKMENADRSKELCGQADQAIGALDFPAAAARLAEANRLWPGNKWVRELQSSLSECREQAEPALAELREAHEAKRYKKVQKLYDAIRNRFHGYSKPELEKEISAKIEEARVLCDKARRSSQKDEVLDLCAEAATLCADLPDIQELSAKYPPDPPGGFSVKADPRARENRLSWSVRSGGRPVRYIVVRSHTDRVQAVTDGKVIFRGNTSSYWDKDIEPGVTYWYNVFADRDGVFSSGAAEGGREAVNLFDMGPVSVTPGNGSLRLSWGTPPRNAAVELYRSGPRGEEHLASTREESFLITGMANEVEQRFRIALSYAFGGRKVETAGVTVSASPVCPPAPVDELGIRLVQEGLYEAVWRHAGPGEVRIVASAQRPDWRAGDVVPLSALEQKMMYLQMLPLSHDTVLKLTQEEGGASFRDPGGEALYITAVVVKSGSAVFGSVVRAGRGMSATIQDIRPENGGVRIFLDAPRDASGFTVRYSYLRFPASPFDRLAFKIDYTREEYALHNALLLGGLEEHKYYFTVFARFGQIYDDQAELIDYYMREEWSTGASGIFDRSPNVVITYSISPARGIFGKSSVTLKFEANEKKFFLPDIDVRAAVGTAPLYKDSASQLDIILGRNVEGSLRVKVPLPKGLPKDTYIKPFFRNEADQAKNQLRLGVGSNHRIT